MNNKGETFTIISLVVVISLIIGIALIFGLGAKVSKYFTGEEEAYEDQLPAIYGSVLEVLGKEVSLMDAPTTNQPTNTRPNFVKQTVRTGANGMWLFFNEGTKPIELVTENRNYGNLTINRPEECEGSACVCYCKEANYWLDSEEKPYLKSTVLSENTPYTCTIHMCQAFQETITFVNSRGNQRYLNQVNTLISQDTKNTLYTPISLDILLLIQESYRDDLRNYDVFFTPLKDTYRYSKYTQATRHTTHLLQQYSWKGGFVLGGYGAPMTKEQEKSRIITQPPVTLKLQNWGHNIVSICPYETCLYEEELEAVKNTVVKQDVSEQLQARYQTLVRKINKLPECTTLYTTLIEYLAHCDPSSEISDLFSVEDVQEVSPKLKITTGISQGDDPKHITILELEDEFGTYESVSAPVYFVCGEEQGADLNLQVYSEMTITDQTDDLYLLEAQGTCILSIQTTPLEGTEIENCDGELCQV